MSLPPYVHPLGHGIHVVDTGFQRDDFDAAYLMVHEGRAAFVDTGTHFSVPRLLGALEALGLARDAVDWVIPTHVHLDHAGGVGTLMRELPQARLLVHPRGARHLIDPTALYQGALAVYGQAEMDRSYGTLVPVPADWVVASADGMQVHLGSRPLTLIDTPGHARHHHCIWDETSRGWFTGDTFGLSYRVFDTPQGAWVLPSSTPVQFEPDALLHSIDRLMAREPACMYLTHFGRVDDTARLAGLLRSLIGEMVALGRSVPTGVDRHAALKEGLMALYQASLSAHGCTLAPQVTAQWLALDVELNAQGMGIWLDRQVA